MRQSSMRALVLLSLLFAVAACSTGGATDPNAAVLQVRLLDDRGNSAGRHQVVVQPSTGASMARVTGNDGTLRAAVRRSATYQVRVIPRDGWMSTPALTRSVRIAASQQATVDFTLLRAGVSTGDVPR